MRVLRTKVKSGVSWQTWDVLTSAHDGNKINVQKSRFCSVTGSNFGSRELHEISNNNITHAVVISNGQFIRENIHHNDTIETSRSINVPYDRCREPVRGPPLYSGVAPLIAYIPMIDILATLQTWSTAPC